MINLISRGIVTVLILAIAYFALHRVWTSRLDLTSLLRKPAESIPIKQEPITVLPSSLVITAADWGKTQLLQLKNSGSETAYSIWIKICGGTEPLKEALEILSEDNEAFMSANVGNINVNYETILIAGKDADNHHALYIVVYRLGPGQTKTFKVNVKPHSSKTEEEAFGKVSVLGFSSIQAPIVSKEGRSAALMINPPEAMTITSTAFYFKKAGNVK